MIKSKISSTAQTILSLSERELRACVGEHVRHSPLLMSVKGRDPCCQHGREEKMLGVHGSYRNRPREKQPRLNSVLCHCTVVLWLMINFLEAEAFPCELPPGGCLPVWQHRPAHLHGKKRNSTTRTATLIFLSQRSILSHSEVSCWPYLLF